MPDYWNPVRVAEFLAGPEDVILGFACGGLVWLMATGPLREPVTVSMNLGPALKRYGTCSLLGLAAGAILFQCPVRPMTYTIVPILAVGLAVLWVRRDLWPLAVTGTAGFTALYGLVAAGPPSR